MNLLDLLYLPIVLLTAPRWMRKKRTGWRERFGHVEHALTHDHADKPTILLHAVSVGEAGALRALVPLLTPHAHVVISVTTDTGLARARTLYADTCDVVRYPLDLSRGVNRFLDMVRPDAVALVELEVWPNFVKACEKRSIPVGVINGRLSARSYKGYRRIRSLLRRTFARLSFVCVQDDAYAERFRSLGATNITVTGSMKWDTTDTRRQTPSAAATQLADDLGLDTSRPIVVAGSTGPAEEALLHACVPKNTQLVCAPRKPERFDEAAAALPDCVRRSTNERRDGATRFLLDTIGELSTLYELADVVVVGRSFGDLHGSDPLEPAALAKPVLIGPAHSDFGSQVRTLDRASAIRVVTKDTLAREICELLEDNALRDALGAAARACVESNQGASAHHAQSLLRLLKTPAGT